MAMRLMLRSRMWRHSGMAFGGCFVDKSLLDGEFHDGFVRPMLESKRTLDGQLRYLHGIDWALVDSLATRHREIAARVLCVWGIDDPTFPVEPAREMASQFAHADFVEIPSAKLLVHEERPEAVVEHVLAFLASP